MIGQVHELVQQVRLPHFCGQGAELLVGTQATPSWCFPYLSILKYASLACNLHCSPLLCPACECAVLQHSLENVRNLLSSKYQYISLQNINIYLHMLALKCKPVLHTSRPCFLERIGDTFQQLKMHPEKDLCD